VNDKFWWYIARSSGMTAWFLLAAAVLWGTLLAGRLVPQRARWVADLHRYLGGVALALTGLHLGALVADSYSHFGWTEVLVPFASTWRAGAVAWGVVTLYVLAAVEVSSLVMRRLGRKVWRAIHLTSYAAFWMATLHGATAGTDAHTRWYQAGAAAAIAVTATAVIARVLARRAGAATAAIASGPSVGRIGQLVQLVDDLEQVTGRVEVDGDDVGHLSPLALALLDSAQEHIGCVHLRRHRAAGWVDREPVVHEEK
jgi:hypothetical protein